MPLHRILTHPFFRSSLHVTPLELSTKKDATASPSPTQPANGGGRRPPLKRYPSSLCRNPTRPRPTLGSHTKSKQAVPIKRMPLEDITNLYAEDSQEDDLLHAPPARHVSAPESLRPLRIFSAVSRPDTVSRALMPAFTADSGLSSLSSGDNVQQAKLSSCTLSLVAAPCIELGVELKPSPRSQLRRVLSDGYSLLSSRRIVSLPSGRPRLFPLHTDAPIHRISSQATTTTVVSHPRSPDELIATKKDTLSAYSAPQPSFNTRRLKPQTHKVSRGQLVVLPSRSLLVDFREGERRKGGRGKEVLVVSADGATVRALIYHRVARTLTICIIDSGL